MRTPTSSFDAADLALCRAHRSAVAEHHADPRTAAALRRDETSTMRYLAARKFERGEYLTDGQSADYWRWQRDVHAPAVAAPPAVAPAAAPVAVPVAVPAAAPVPPAAPANAASTGDELRHLVCCLSDGVFSVGNVLGHAFPRGAREAVERHHKGGRDWRLCDADGFIPHVPAADSVCPVPDGIEFQAKNRNGDVVSGKAARLYANLWRRYSECPNYPADYVAWRPVGAAA